MVSPHDRTDADALDFARRLGRVRGIQRKARYLRIQAVQLFDVGTPELTEAAFGLLDQLLAEFAEPFQLAGAYSLRADCLIDLGRPEEAPQDYESSLLACRTHFGIQDDGYLSYAELILALGCVSLYDAALAAIEEFGGSTPFPIQQYRIAALR